MTTDIASARTADEIAASKQSADAEFAAAVKERFDRALDEAGLLDEEGAVDKSVLADRVCEELRTKRVVHIGSDQDDRYEPATSSTKDELTAAVFTAGPTVTDAERNEVERKAYEKCQAAVWNLTQASARGHIQQRLEADKLFVIRGRVFRNGNPIEAGVYVSTQPEVVLRELIGPRIATLRKLADALAGDYAMLVDRLPELEAPVRAAIGAAMTETAAKLPAPALESDNGNGRKALGK